MHHIKLLILFDGLCPICNACVRFITKINHNKTIGLCDIKFLSKGSYGEVYEFSNKDYKVAIKTYKYSDDTQELPR